MRAADAAHDAWALVERTTGSQNLPQHVEDPATIGRVAALLRPQRDSAPGGRAGGRCKDSSAGRLEGVGYG